MERGRSYWWYWELHSKCRRVSAAQLCCSASSCSPRETLSVLPEILVETLEEQQSCSSLFPKAIDDLSSNLGMYPEDEWNLLYVAVTRAKKYLLMSKSLENLLALAGVSEIFPR